MQIKSALHWASKSLNCKGVENPCLEVMVLLSSLLRKEKVYLYSRPSLQLSSSHMKKLSEMIDKRNKGYPLAYIVGEKEFMSLPFIVNESVMIPRPETEVLVEETLKLVDSSQQKEKKPPLILDIGTGSGNIALSLAKYTKDAQVFATDISYSALDVAFRNRKNLKLEDRVSFVHSDVRTDFQRRDWESQIDFLVSNPPYVKTHDFGRLAPEVLCEPRVSLDGGSDGLRFYPFLVKAGEIFLRRGGYIIMEVGKGQAKEVKSIIEASGKFEKIYVKRDYNGIERVLIARRK